MKDLIKALATFGLSDKEALIYLTLYKLDEATAYQVAKESGLKRPTVYVLLDELRHKGLVLLTPYPKKQLYRAKDLYEFMDERSYLVRNSASLLLRSLPKLINNSSKVLTFSGADFRTGLSYGLTKSRGQSFLALYAGLPAGKVASQIYLDHHLEILEVAKDLKCLVPSKANDGLFKNLDTRAKIKVETKVLPLTNQTTSVELSGAVVKFIFHSSKQVVIVEDAGLANLANQLFMTYWRGF